MNVNNLLKTGCLKIRNPFCSIALSTVNYWERLPQQGLGIAAIPCRSPHPRHPSTESAFLVSARLKTVSQTRNRPSWCLPERKPSSRHETIPLGVWPGKDQSVGRSTPGVAALRGGRRCCVLLCVVVCCCVLLGVPCKWLAVSVLLKMRCLFFGIPSHLNI